MNTRKKVLDILYRVMQEGGYASIILRDNKCILKNEMPFVSNLVYGVLRNYRYLEAHWKPYAKRSKPKTALALDMAIYELFFTSAKEYAVVNETVELVNAKEKSFVNAILRKVQMTGKKDFLDPCVQYSHPDWIYHMWQAHYGKEEAIKIMQADQVIPNVIGRINPLKMTKDTLEKDPSITFMNDYCFISETNIISSNYFKEAQVLIQNPSSIEPVLALDLKDNLNVLDVCAAPGTKTQLISSLMHNTGEIIACDLYPQRLSLIQQLMDRCGNTNVKTIVNDATLPTFEEESFDRILCDVPCSGLGDLSHKPEIRWHLKPEDIDSLLQTQEKILEVSSSYLKKEGMLVYSTCTLNKKENTGQILSFLKRHNNFILVSEKTIFPYERYHDGFYVAVLKKQGSIVVK